MPGSVYLLRARIGGYHSPCPGLRLYSATSKASSMCCCCLAAGAQRIRMRPGQGHVQHSVRICSIGFFQQRRDQLHRRSDDICNAGPGGFCGPCWCFGKTDRLLSVNSEGSLIAASLTLLLDRSTHFRKYHNKPLFGLQYDAIV